MQRSSLALILITLSATQACSRPAGGEPAATSGNNAGRTGRAGGPTDRPAAVEIELVKRGSVSRSSVIAGMLEPIRAVGVNSQIAGILLALKVEEGNRVNQGDVLAEIDARELEAQVRSAEASLKFAQSTAERSENLYKQQIITLAELERDRTAFESAKATHEQLKTRLGYARVLAPISGIITQKNVEAGDIVGTQTRLFTIADVSTLVARVQVSELAVASLRTGDVVPISVDALGGERVQGRIRRIFPAADSATRLVPVEVALAGNSRLRPGYTVRATLALDRRDDALLVRSSAISGPAGARAVYIVRNGVVERRPVNVGGDIAGQTEVLSGLGAGDSVIVSGTSMLREGSKTRVVEPLDDRVPPGKPIDSTASAATTAGRGG